MTITAAADGSALGNPGPAGWAWYIDDDHWAAGGWKHGTNNMGELKAVLELFRATNGVDDDLLVLCDSQYVINSVTSWMPGWKRRGWRKADGKPVLNVELLQELDEAIAGRRYRFEWVKGHVGHELNEAADERARAVATAFQRGAGPIPTGPGFGPVNGAPATVRAPAPEVPATAPSPSLFDLADGTAGGRSVTVELAADEWARLEQRARRAGMSPEDLLRDLAARG
ncbi:MAG: Ribonuclease [Amnibacterium sp.]|nr:ribonuclease H [Amnibacterium sp.]MCU1472046.1 Ribonuclease [Amnibacterium sp.]